MIISSLMAIVFASLSGLHVFWAFGYTWGLEAAVPQQSNTQTEKALNPGPVACGIVAVGLALFSLFYANQVLNLPLLFSESIEAAMGYGIPSIFALRVIGEFKYVGLFKKVKDTTFAAMDTAYYIPLCIGIALGGYYLAC